MILLDVVSADAVKERDYFLSCLNNPWAINGIRILAVVVLAVFMIAYFKYKKK